MFTTSLQQSIGGFCINSVFAPIGDISYLLLMIKSFHAKTADEYTCKMIVSTLEKVRHFLIFCHWLCF